MKQEQIVRWPLPALILILLVVAACTGIANDQPINTLVTPASIFSPTPVTDENAAQAGTPDLLVVVVTPTPVENGEAADASADAGVTASDEGGDDEGAAAGATPAATGEAPGEAAEEGDQENATPAALEMSETELLSNGEQVYTQNCASCHQLNGAGAATYPALDNSAIVMDEDPTVLISTIWLGRGQMPAFADTLSPEQIASVASYVRDAWNNNADVVMPAQVSQVAEGGSAATTTEDASSEDGTTADAAAEEPNAQDAATENTGAADADADNGVTTTEEDAAAQSTPAATAPLTETATVTATTQSTATTAAPTGTAPITTTATTATTTPTLPTAAGATWTPAPIVTATIAATAVTTGTPTAPAATDNGTPQAQATPSATGETAAGSSANNEQLISMGEEIFAQECASCHQLNGEGTSSYPALNNNEVVTSEDPSAALRVILHGRGQMPAFADNLSAEEIAAVLSYVRNAWDNSASAVSIEQVTQGGDSGADTGDDSTTTQSETEGQAAATTATPSATGTMTTSTTPEAEGSGAAAATPTAAAATSPMTTTATPAAAATTSAPAPDDPNQAEDEATGVEDSVQPSEEEEATEAGVPRQAGPVVEPPEEDNMTAMDEAAEEATVVSPEELIGMGENLYTMNCAACHQAEGQGVANAYPPLAGNAFVTTEDPTPVIQVIITGRAGMPRFSADLSAREIAAIVSYVRNAWGNDAAPVSPDQARSVRESAESGGH